MLWQAIMVLAGVLLRLATPLLLPAAAGLLLGSAALVLLWPRRCRPLALLLAGAALAEVAASQHYGAIQRSDERVLVEAAVTSIPRVTATAVSFEARLHFVREVGRPAQQARLSWPGGDGRRLQAGDRWQLLLRLRPPRLPYNPASVDAERNALRDHVQALGSVIDSRLNVRLASQPATLLALRERLASRISAVVPDPASGALLAALAVGATGEVTREQWRVFNATGITHLVAISGMHVTLFAVIAMGAARWLWSWAARCGLRLRRERCATLAGLLLASGYALLAGFSVPTQRTLLMLAAWLVLRESGRASRPSASLALALLAVLAWDPFAVLSAGFWLSFVAVAAIIGIAGGALLEQGTLRTAVTVQLAVFAGLLPVTFAIFGSVSLAGLLVNVAAIPLFTFTLVPLALAATAALLILPQAVAAPFADTLLTLGGSIAAQVTPWLAAAADSPHALWLVQAPLPWYLLGAGAVFTILLPWAWRLRSTALLALLPLLAPAARPRDGELSLTVFDVGQSSAVLVQTARHAVLQGVGEGFRGRGSTVERVVLPGLRARGLQRLDALLLPRLDRDTGEGVTALATGVSLPQVLAGGPAQVALPPEFARCAAAPAWEWDGWRFELLHEPSQGCALRVQGGGLSLLLAPLLDGPAGQALAAQAAAHADVLLVPRSAAQAASPDAFLAATGARLAVASLRASARDGAGYERVATRYAGHGIALVDTATGGAIELRLGPERRITLTASRTPRIGVWSLDPAAIR